MHDPPIDGIGQDLDELLRRLRASSAPAFNIGVREVADARLMVLQLAGRAKAPVELGGIIDYLAPVLARTAEESAAFYDIAAPLATTRREQIARTRAVPDEPADRPTGPGISKRRQWVFSSASLRILIVPIIALAVLTPVVLMLWPDPHKTQVVTQPAAPPPPCCAPVEPDKDTDGPGLGKRSAGAGPSPSIRLNDAAQLHGGMPTLREIAASLRSGAPIALTTEDYLRRLRDLTALPADVPLVINAPASGGTVLSDKLKAASVANKVRIIWAVSQMEYPDSPFSYDESLSEFLQHEDKIAADIEIRGTKLLAILMTNFLLNKSWTISPADLKETQRLRAVVDQETASSIDHPPAAPELAVTIDRARRGMALPLTNDYTARRASDNLRRIVAPSDTKLFDDDDIVARAVTALAPGWRPADAPWAPAYPDEPTTPSWVAWLAALATFIALVVLLLPLIDPRRAFLRRRSPLVKPHRSALIENAVGPLFGSPGTIHDIRKALQRREPLPNRHLNIRATIRATIAAGTGAVVPRFATTSSAPDYLALIDRRGVADLEADRVTALIAPLRASAIGLDVYYFDGDPSRAYAARGGGAVRIEELMARFAHHRLLLMTSGEAMIDLFTGYVRGGFAKLAHWRRRGMLTAVPVSEWGRQERLIARSFDAPVTRSTATGLLALSQRLLNEDRVTARQLIEDGDEGAPPLPRDLVRLIDLLPDDASEDDPILADLVRELGWYPDVPGFEWLCALAVYPAITFDLALYLGELPEHVASIDGPALFNPRRLSALTRLPWLQRGYMPAALRRKLIERLSPARARQVRGALFRLIASARSDDQKTERNRAGFGTESDAAQDKSSDRVFEDEVLVDFMRDGRVEDFELVIERRPAMPLLARFRQLDPVALAAVALILAYAVASWFVTPGPNDGEATDLLWLPLQSLALAALVSLVMLRSGSLRRYFVRRPALLPSWCAILIVLSGVAVLLHLMAVPEVLEFLFLLIAGFLTWSRARPRAARARSRSGSAGTIVQRFAIVFVIEVALGQFWLGSTSYVAILVPVIGGLVAYWGTGFVPQRVLRSISGGTAFALALAFLIVWMIGSASSNEIESWVTGAGLPALIPALAPPLGFTAQMMLAFGVAIFTALALIALFALPGIVMRIVRGGQAKGNPPPDARSSDPDAIESRAALFGEASLTVISVLALILIAGSGDDRPVNGLLALILIGGGILLIRSRFSHVRDPGPEPDLKQLRRRPWPWIAALFLISASLILPSIWLASTARDGRAVLAPAGAERIIATSGDGLIAVVSGDDGRTIDVMSADHPSTVLDSFAIKALPADAKRQAETGRSEIGVGPILSLAVMRNPRGGGLLVAAATADGFVTGFDGGGKQHILGAFDSTTPLAPSVTAARFAFTPDGILIYAQDMANGAARITIDNELIDLVKPQLASFAGAPRITAMSIIGKGLLVWGSADGLVHAIDIRPAAGGFVATAVAPDMGSPMVYLTSGPRLIRPVGVATPMFVAVADDGTAILGAFNPDHTILLTQSLPAITELAVGPNIEWAGPRRASWGNAPPPAIKPVIVSAAPAPTPTPTPTVGTATARRPSLPASIVAGLDVLPEMAVPPVESQSPFIWPLRGPIAKPFGAGEDGARNDGIKIEAAIGTPVVSVADGVVIYTADAVPGLGGLVMIKHGSTGWTSVYGHLGKITVQRGMVVKRGDTIGLSGDTGFADRPELHFELRFGRTPINPLTQLPQ